MSPFVNLWLPSLFIFVIFTCILRRIVHLSYANSVDTDQTPRFAASNLGLHLCLCPFYGTLDINEINY